MHVRGTPGAESGREDRVLCENTALRLIGIALDLNHKTAFLDSGELIGFGGCEEGLKKVARSGIRPCHP